MQLRQRLITQTNHSPIARETPTPYGQKRSIMDRLLRAEARRSKSASSRLSVKATGLFNESQLAALELEHTDGITAAQLVSLFSNRGMRFSEATFRKYVQKGLLPRSRRVGRKGKHRGSLGVYPAKTIRRVNSIKKLMGEGFTIEEIQSRFLRYTDFIEVLEEQVTDLFARFTVDVQEPRFDKKARKSLTKEIAEAQKSADDLIRRVAGLSGRMSGLRDEDLGPAGAAGSAEDLL